MSEAKRYPRTWAAVDKTGVVFAAGTLAGFAGSDVEDDAEHLVPMPHGMVSVGVKMERAPDPRIAAAKALAEAGQDLMHAIGDIPRSDLMHEEEQLAKAVDAFGEAHLALLEALESADN